MDGSSLMLLVFIVLMGGFMFWSQWRSRKRYQEQVDALQVGDRIVTIGGIYGRVTALDREGNRARIEIARDIEIEISLRAISHQADASGQG